MTVNEPITINALITLLRNVNPNAQIRFDFPPYQFPTEIDSWRGSYDEPALGHAGRDSHNQSSVNMFNRCDTPPTVADLITELQKAINGKSYEGWKGGTYYFNGDQIIHVDNPGEYNHTIIVGISGDGFEIIIHTQWID